jgi:hypothetical protein
MINMKTLIISLVFSLALASFSKGQTADPLVSECVMNTGDNTKYLKDFRVQLGSAQNQSDLRYKANMSLWKNTKYRFSMCNAANSKGKLILTIKDETNKLILSSYDKSTGRVYPFIDFTCNKSGIYQLCFDFENGQQGSGVGVVSMVR